MTDIKDLTKEELITVIAEMHDIIQDWYDWGLSSVDIETLTMLGNQAGRHCSKENAWGLEEISKKLKENT